MVLFRMRGVPVKVGWSWLVVVALVYASLWSSLFPSTYPGLAPGSYLLMAGVATLLFFASILVHELSHTWWSLREGVRVRDITLWLFGGVSRADEPLPGPGAELRVVHDLGAPLSLDDLVLVPPIAEPGAAVADLGHELLVLGLARVAGVLGTEPGERVARGRLALGGHLLPGFDQQPPQQISALFRQMVG